MPKLFRNYSKYKKLSFEVFVLKTKQNISSQTFRITHSCIWLLLEANIWDEEIVRKLLHRTKDN